MRFNNKFYKIYDGILAVSDALRNLVIEQGYSDKSKTGVIYDIINVDMIRKMADEFIEMSFNGIKIVTVGRLTPPKNHILAVETAKRLKGAGVNFHWWFVGGGCEYDNMSIKLKNSALKTTLQ